MPEHAITTVPKTVAELEAENRSLRAALAVAEAGEAHFRAALELSATALCTHDRELRYTWIYHPHMGFTPEQVLGRTDWDILEPELAARMGALKRRVLETGVGLRAEVPTRLDDPAAEVFDLIIEPLHDEHGAVSGMSCAGVNITDMKRAQAAERAANHRLATALAAERQAMREQRNFLAMVSHEFRGPLAVIHAASQLLQGFPVGRDETVFELGKINRAVDRMLDLIDVFLGDERLDAASTPVVHGPVALGPLLAEVAEEKRTKHPASPLIIEGEASVEIRADGALLRVALGNLVENALKFSPAGAPVTVRLDTEGSVAVVTVADKGPGISAQDQTRIFEKFFRSTRTDNIQGVGLGLHIVRRIIDLHGGAISVRSRPGAGTVFTVRLPADPDAVPAGG